VFIASLIVCLYMIEHLLYSYREMYVYSKNDELILYYFDETF
jgi:hypothetical protein